MQSFKKYFLLLAATFFAIGCSDSWTIYNTSNSDLPSNDISHIAVDHSGNVWVATVNEDSNSMFDPKMTLAKFDGKSWTIFDSANSPLDKPSIHSITADNSNNIWFVTEDGLVKYNGKQWKRYTTENSGMPSNIHSFETDNSGNKWMVTNSSELVQHDGQNIVTHHSKIVKFNGDKWTTISPPDWQIQDETEADNPELSSFPIKTITADSSGNIWAGSKGRAVAKYDGNNWKIYHEPANKRSYKLSNNLVTGIAVEMDGSFWVATKDGLYKNEADRPIYHDSIENLVVDENGSKWFYQKPITGGTPKDVYLVSFKEGYNDGKKHNIEESSLPGFVTEIAPGQSGKVWIGTHKGLVLVEK